ncbi:MAG: pentapeptide repeat-containing protein [Verrucomicrobiales bacterium]|nr:pentapeptide repeat-containing protein [Verrucomicrobiales bacterium]
MQKFTNANEVDIVSSALLQEGVIWEKQMRKERSAVSVDMSGSLLFKARLANAQANGLDCSGMSFGAADLKFSSLPSCVFDDCNLVRAVLDGALLNNASLNSASLSEVSAVKADFSFAKCNRTEFRKAALNSATFKQTTLDAADFTRATLDDASFSQAKLRSVRFVGASLRKTIFSQTDVTTAVFDDADVEGADFTAAAGVTKALLAKAKNSDKALLPPEPKTTTNKP